MDRGLYEVLILVGLLIGIGPGLYFLITFRPESWWTWLTVDVCGWIIAILMLYSWAILSILGDWNKNDVFDPDLGQALFGILIVGLIDAMLMIRAYVWSSLRKSPSSHNKEKETIND